MKIDIKELLQQEILHGEKYSPFKVFLTRKENTSYDAIYLIRTYLAWSEEHSHPISRRKNKRKLETRYGIFIGPNVKIGKGLILPHPNGIVIGKGCVIGDNATIYQQVTIGGARVYASKSADGTGYPKIGNNCVFYKGCTIIGGINVGNDTIVGANALLNITTDGGTYVGVPAKKL